MVTISVDKKLCTGDGKCVDVCPINILKMNDDRVPEFVTGGADTCIKCGHCFSVCPHGAITLESANPKDALILDPSKLPAAGQVKLFLKGRRSVRRYTDEPLDAALINELLDIARYAPSGINRQPVSWAVLQGTEKVHELTRLVIQWIDELLAAKSDIASAYRFSRLSETWKQGKDLICRGAPCLVTAYGVKDDPMVPPSCTIAATYLELAAFGLGLGACWAGYVQMAANMDERVKKFMGIPARAAVGAVMMVGHPKHQYMRIPPRNPAKVIWK